MPALAAPPTSCPDDPAIYTGADDAILQANAARRDAVQTCHALADRLDLAAAQATTASGDAHTDAASAVAAINAEHDVSVSNAAAISDPVAASADAAALAQKGAMWFLIGLAACALPGYGLYRAVMPRV